MIDGLRVLALVPARGGSKGVPRKNIRDLGGKPLIAWTIEAALASRYIDDVVLSSDDAEIIETAVAWGASAPFVRPAELATDSADSLSVVRHALRALPTTYDVLVLLQPTSPLRSTADIDGAIGTCLQAGAAACVSICEVEKSPFWMMEVQGNGRLSRLLADKPLPTRRQDAPPSYTLNGAVYVARCSDLLAGNGFLGDDTVPWIMPKERSFDIDTEFDLKYLRFYLSEGQNG
ncbi:acylneuraminate cytidylyltransferase family protein [Insolitispirillum peregrinum]|uniref:acylneuraminate cytidylyltransferase family protein n=1 Tax=Insolitispirillum peregrinum TaxID=80876 RepID=UPI00361DA658